MRARVAAVAGLVACACGGGSGQPDAGPPDADPADAGLPDVGGDVDIADYLAGIDGLVFTEERDTQYEGYRRFTMTFQQPLDHGAAGGTQLGQRMVLHHVDRGAPMILYTTGYMLFGDDYLSELGLMLRANQISTEQRFFDLSIPDGVSAAEWAQVTIAQAAADHHRVVQVLAPFYGGAWVSTGHSKGGMTSIYHRRFYPDDVDATVAYVAPISFATGDPRYLAFFDQVGPAGCEAALELVQREALERFAAMLTRAQTVAAGQGYEYTRWNGGHAQALESALTGLPWSFWQYGPGQGCDNVPDDTATDDALFAFVSQTAGIGTPDHALVNLQTYYYQAATQLGSPAMPTEHIADLLTHQGDGMTMPPDGVPTVYDGAVAMNDVAAWVQGDGERIMFLYGEWDPWYGGAFDPTGASDSPLFVVPQASHGALIAHLPQPDLGTALDTIERWTGVAPLAAALALVRPPPQPARIELRQTLLFTPGGAAAAP
jgi:hypothetical protein